MRCPDCASDNPPDYRFCGMCGTPLEKPQPVSASVGRVPVKRPEQTAERPHPASTSLSGPSFLGLSGDGSRHGGTDSSRDLSYLLEDEEPKRTYGRFVLLLVILLAIGGFVFLGFSKTGKEWLAHRLNQTPKTPVQASQPLDQTAPSPSEPVSPQPTAPTTGQPTAQNAQAPSKEVGPAEKDIPPSGTASPDEKAATKVENPPQSESKQKTSAEAVADSGSAKASGAEKVSGEAGTAPTEAKPAKFTPTPPKTKPAPQAPVVSEDDALVANAEKYLYGRGVPQNCDRALSSLRAAAQRQNSRARSLLGSMYATGHCVPRDLPSAYRWFALASRDNTDNLWVQRNLEMIWREMTPQERQLATQRNQ